jgi:hypothetical protein
MLEPGSLKEGQNSPLHLAMRLSGIAADIDGITI